MKKILGILIMATGVVLCIPFIVILYKTVNGWTFFSQQVEAAGVLFLLGLWTGAVGVRVRL